MSGLDVDAVRAYAESGAHQCARVHADRDALLGEADRLRAIIRELLDCPDGAGRCQHCADLAAPHLRGDGDSDG